MTEWARRNQNLIKIARLARRTVLFNLAAMLIAVLLGAARSGWRAALTFDYIFHSFVYANCIGTLIALIVVFGVESWRDDSSFVRFVKLTAALFVATFVGIVLANAMLATLGFELWSQMLSLSWQLAVLSLVIAFGLGFGTYFYELSQTHLAEAREKLHERELDAARARTLATEARLSSLESRVRPHFLFNTLNSISALVREEPERAERTVERLGALLRFSLDAANQKTVRLSEEIRVVRDYLEIEKTRFGARLKFSFAIEDAAEDFKIPPFALQTLVENSIKHHVSKTGAGGEIRISAQIEGNFLRLEVQDDGAGFDESDVSENHGLDNLQARLSALYGKTAALKIERRDRFTVVSVIIPAAEVK